MTSVAFDQRWLGKSVPENHWHFHRQLLLRYGFVLGPGEFSQMIRDIQNGQALLIERRAKNAAIYSVRIHKQFERISCCRTGNRSLPPGRQSADLTISEGSLLRRTGQHHNLARCRI